MVDNLDFKLPNLEKFIEPNPLTVSPETPVVDAIAWMNQPRNFSSSEDRTKNPVICCSSYLLVLEQSQLVGILTERDLVKFSASAIDLETVTVKEVMTTNFSTLDRNELYEVISTLKQELSQQTKHLKQEIEQREKSELLLREHQQLLELFVRRAPAAIAMLDCQMRYLVVSDRWIQDYQLEKKDIIGLTHYEVFPELPQRWKQDHQDMLTGKVEFLKSEEDSFERPDGRIDWIRWELRPWHNLEGKIGGLLMLCEIITERKLLEQKLFAEKELAQVTLKSIGDAVITTDASGKVKYLNPIAERLTGWATTEVKGKPITDFF